MITHACRAGSVVQHKDGRKGLVTGWIGEPDALNESGQPDDQRKCGVMMRMGPGQPFQQYWFPFKEFCDDFTAVGKLDE